MGKIIATGRYYVVRYGQGTKESRVEIALRRGTDFITLPDSEATDGFLADLIGASRDKVDDLCGAFDDDDDDETADLPQRP
jgi:hypothetical protein